MTGYDTGAMIYKCCWCAYRLLVGLEYPVKAKERKKKSGARNAPTITRLSRSQVRECRHSGAAEYRLVSGTEASFRPMPWEKSRQVAKLLEHALSQALDGGQALQNPIRQQNVTVEAC